ERARHVQPAGLDRGDRFAALAGDQRVAGTRRVRGVARSDVDRLGRRRLLGDRVLADRARPVLRTGAEAPGGAGHAVAAARAGGRGAAGGRVLRRRTWAAAVDWRRDGARRRAADRAARAGQVARTAAGAGHLAARRCRRGGRVEATRGVAEVARRRV